MTVLEEEISMGVPSSGSNDQLRFLQGALRNNAAVEDALHVVAVVSNPCGFAKRWTLAREFIKRMQRTSHVLLYVVEVAYGDQAFMVTDAGNPSHLQMRETGPALWLKERLVNLGVEKLLPPHWKAFAYIDADIQFENPMWALDTLKLLNGAYDVLQLFSHCVDLGPSQETMRVFSGYGYNTVLARPFQASGPDMWHPGYAWAMTRHLYDALGGLYDKSILGSADHQMALSIVSNDAFIWRYAAGAPGYRDSLLSMFLRMQKLNPRLGYTPGLIRHFYHGSKKNRGYDHRWKILLRHGYDPDKHLAVCPDTGLYRPSPSCPAALLQEIQLYFQSRREDDDA